MSGGPARPDSRLRTQRALLASRFSFKRRKRR